MVTRCKLIQTATPFFILKAYTIQSLPQTNVHMLQCRQSLSEIVGYHRDLVVVQVAKGTEGKANWLYGANLFKLGHRFFFPSKSTLVNLCLKPAYSFCNLVNP